jgi:O-methyltransferase involved in polyketide biosynthesis
MLAPLRPADPMAITLADSIEFDYAKFGRTRQVFALRALTFDIHTRRYLNDHPSATVVALAEGLQTSFWRLDAAISDSQFRWLTMDLPPIIDLRTRLLPESPRIAVRAQSALDYSWTDSPWLRFSAALLGHSCRYFGQKGYGQEAL